MGRTHAAGMMAIAISLLAGSSTNAEGKKQTMTVANQKTISLPSPVKTGGMPLMEALQKRRSSRSFDTRELTQQHMSDLLWAAWGISDESGKRTAPSARNMQEIDVYVVVKGGVYRYNAKAHALDPVMAGDVRGATGTQDFPAIAPVNLVFVADYGRMGSIPQAQREAYASADAAYISQNVYLYCASAGLATVVRASVDKMELGKKLGLGEYQDVVFAQTVGYPGE